MNITAAVKKLFDTLYPGGRVIDTDKDEATTSLEGILIDHDTRIDTLETSIVNNTTIDQFWQVSASPDEESTNAIAVNCVIEDFAGNAVEYVNEVVVETFAPTAGAGQITVVTGTELMNTGAPAGKQSLCVLQTNDHGVFKLSIADTHAESVLLRLTLDGGITSVLLTFA